MGRRRQFGDLLLFGVTFVELTILIITTPAFTITDWIYVSQHILVLGIALTRPEPKALDQSFGSSAAVLVSYAYPYAQVLYLQWAAGYEGSPAVGLALVSIAAVLSLVSLITLGRFFGVRPALRGLVTKGPYAVVRHPIYLSYLVADIGYNLQEWSFVTVLVVLAGWISLIYRIAAEEQILGGDPGWSAYSRTVRYRLLPGIW